MQNHSTQKMFGRVSFGLVLGFLSLSLCASPTSAGAQGLGESIYPTDVFPLSHENGFFHTHPAPDFWLLMPYLMPQTSNSSCSVASAAVVLNAARAHIYPGVEAIPYSEFSVLQKTADATWVLQTQEDGGGVSLEQFVTAFKKALPAHEFEESTLTVFSARIAGQLTLEKFRSDLIENEKSGDDFMIINFDQGYVMNSEQVGHFAAVGAFDEGKDWVLLLDPDKKAFEPYWVPTPKLFQAMVNMRGYVKVEFKGKNRL